jgi:hypothetical protein
MKKINEVTRVAGVRIARVSIIRARIAKARIVRARTLVIILTLPVDKIRLII